MYKICTNPLCQKYSEPDYKHRLCPKCKRQLKDPVKKMYRKIYYRMNKDKEIARNKDWANKNRERRRASALAYYHRQQAKKRAALGSGA
jgi:hypothetical protein